MSAVAQEWIAVFIFFACVAAFTIGEAVWLKRKNGTSFGKTLAFASTTNFFGFCGVFFVVFIIFGVVLAMAWDGSLQEVPGQDYTIFTVLIAAVFFPFILLTLVKRILLKPFKFQTGKPAWIFSIISSFLILATSMSLLILFLYIFNFN